MRTDLLKVILYLLTGVVLTAASCHKSAPPVDVEPPQGETWTWTIDTLHYDGPPPAPDRIRVQSIWGSSPRDVWAVAASDDILGELWHYDGTRWRVVTDWPYNGIDGGGSYLNIITAVSGFDSNNVFLFGIHSYDTTGTDLVFKWDGVSWSTLPWEGGTAPRGGLGWGERQAGGRLWAVSTTGQVVKYENGFLSVDTVIDGFRFMSPIIGALDNGEVYVNAFRDSIEGGTLQGTITRLYKRDIFGSWTLLENKFVEGASYDGNGLGRGLVSVRDRLFTNNQGLWERVNESWVLRKSFAGHGGECFASETDYWCYFNNELWHYLDGDWQKIETPVLRQIPGTFLYGRGWSDGNEIFISLTTGIKGYILHGKAERSVNTE